MGFFDILGKIANGAEDFMIAAGNQYAKGIDRMSDEEIEKKYSKPADEVRMDADMLQMKCEKAQMLKEKREMEVEIRRLKQEQYEMNNKKDRRDNNGEYDDDI